MNVLFGLVEPLGIILYATALIKLTIPVLIGCFCCLAKCRAKVNKKFRSRRKATKPQISCDGGAWITKW